MPLGQLVSPIDLVNYVGVIVKALEEGLFHWGISGVLAKLFERLEIGNDLSLCYFDRYERELREVS
ncbi:hypothetical protein TorRG33x02_225460 [Trema orientale]|uniref:Uncharacterized protein n=1 Tax=Trema orientale TaxID=63057 RepID=A0A2P5E7W7_TREOI|nr:hypothetical protein TorRG33x02_225460 [Trema orientale]